MGDYRELRKFLLYVDSNKNNASAHGIRDDYQQANPEVDVTHLRELSEPDFLSEESRLVKILITQGNTQAYENRQVSAYKISIKGKRLMKNFGSFWIWIDSNDKRTVFIKGVLGGFIALGTLVAGIIAS